VRKQLAGCVLVLTAVMAGCHRESGDEYVGTWTNVSDHGRKSLAIEKHGDIFIVKWSSFMGPSQATAVLKDGALQLQTSLGTNAYMIDRTNGHLLADGAEYQREQGKK